MKKPNKEEKCDCICHENKIQNCPDCNIQDTPLKDWEKPWDNILTEYLESFEMARITRNFTDNKKQDKKLVDFIRSLLAQKVGETRALERERIREIIETEMGIDHSVETGATLAVILSVIK